MSRFRVEPGYVPTFDMLLARVCCTAERLSQFSWLFLEREVVFVANFLLKLDGPNTNDTKFGDNVYLRFRYIAAFGKQRT